MLHRARSINLMITLAACTVLCASVRAEEPLELKTMAWNIWHGGREDGEKTGPQRVVEIIRDSGADIVAMQETYGSGKWISEQLGFHFHPRGTNVSIHSRFPVVEDISVHEAFQCVGAVLELPDKRKIAFYSIWLPYSKEIWEEGTRNTDDPDSMRAACEASRASLEKIWEAIQKRLSDPAYNDMPIIIAGDFNSMSHLDYIAPFKDQYDGVVIDWPTSRIMANAGFIDSWREVHPEVNRRRDRTWTPRFPKQEQDRIDYIYYRGADLNAIDARIIDERTPSFPSDHAAIVTDFSYFRPTAGPAVRVGTYNIKHGLGNDDRLDLRRAGGLLKNLRLDVIGLQEMDQQVRRSNGVDQPTALGKQLDMHSAFGSFMDYQGGQYGLAILSKYPILESKEVRLPDGNEPRVALACKIQLPNDQVIVAVNLHFDWVRDDQFRFAQAKVLKQYLDTLKDPYLLMGDFNDTPESRTLSLLSQNACPAKKPADDVFTFSSIKPTKEIDFIFAAPQQAWKLEHCRVVDAPITSDHRPVIATYRLKQ